MNKGISCLLLLWSSFAFATERQWESAVCGQQVSDLLKQWPVYAKVEKPFNLADQTWVQYVFSKNPGFFLKLESAAQGSVAMTRFSPLSAIKLTWSPPNCTASYSALEVTKDSHNAFNDISLYELLQKEKTGLIYIWSEHMPLSTQGVAQIREVAKRLGAHLTLIAEASTSPENIKKFAPESKILLSRELQARGAANHYPVLMTYRNGEVLNYKIPGYRLADAYVVDLQNLIKAAKF